MVMQTDIDMNNHDISVKNPTKDDNVVSLGYLKSLKQYFLIDLYFNRSKSETVAGLIKFPFNVTFEHLNLYNVKNIKKQKIRYNFTFHKGVNVTNKVIIKIEFDFQIGFNIPANAVSDLKIRKEDNTSIEQNTEFNIKILISKSLL